jgi:hypothetical protein
LADPVTALFVIKGLKKIGRGEDSHMRNELVKRTQCMDREAALIDVLPRFSG